MATVRDLSDPKLTITELDLLGPRIEFLIPPNGDGLSVLKGIVPAGVSVLLHSHPDTEAFYIIAGELQMFSETANDWIVVKSGQFVYIPGEEKHAWRNASAEHATALLITTAKLGRFFEEIGATISHGTHPSAPSPERLRHYIETETRYGYWSGNSEENAEIGITL
jgi:quercetin dioxygenase-like cupin family protein